jgi:ribosomal protein S18 acetylase RimI-like enzyme
LNFREWKLPANNDSQNDFDIVRNILLSTWLDTYSKIIPPEELNAYLNISCSNEKLEELLKDKFTKGMIAEVNKKPAGWLRTNINQTENKFYINQLYVLKKHQGKGIGKKLIRIAEEEALKNKFKKVWLGVMSENIPSVNWYKSLGFIFEKEEPFKMINTKVNHLIGWKEIQLSI